LNGGYTKPIELNALQGGPEVLVRVKLEIDVMHL